MSLIEYAPQPFPWDPPRRGQQTFSEESPFNPLPFHVNYLLLGRSEPASSYQNLRPHLVRFVSSLLGARLTMELVVLIENEDLVRASEANFNNGP